MEGLVDILIKVLPWLGHASGNPSIADILVKATPLFGAVGLPFLFYATTPLLFFGMYLIIVQADKRRSEYGS